LDQAEFLGVRKKGLICGYQIRYRFARYTTVR